VTQSVAIVYSTDGLKYVVLFDRNTDIVR